MRRLRYICGGDEGREASGSCRCEDEDGGEVMTGEVEIAGIALSGGGAPFTS